VHAIREFRRVDVAVPRRILICVEFGAVEVERDPANLGAGDFARALVELAGYGLAFARRAERNCGRRLRNKRQPRAEKQRAGAQLHDCLPFNDLFLLVERNFSDANIASRLVPAGFAVAATREVLGISLLHQPVNVRPGPRRSFGTAFCWPAV
jgi:hypothetical protein